MTRLKEPPRARTPKVSKRYYDLVRVFPLVRLADDRQLRGAEIMIEQLLQENLDPGGQAYLDALTDLVELYENEHHAIEPRPGPHLLASMLADHGLSQADLARQTGIAKSTLSAILAGQRSLTLGQMRTLGKRFALDPAAFIGD